MTTSINIDKTKGRRVTQIKAFPVEKLRLDPENVRFLHIGKPLSDKQMEEMLWAEDETRTLLKTIIASGGLSTRPVITSKGVVKEGNRRTVCLRRIRELIKDGDLPQLQLRDFEKVDCEVLPDEITQREVDIYLARVHVSGVKEWDALNQAGHIWRMYNDRQMTLDEMVDLLGISKGKIFQRLKAFQWTKEFMDKYPKEADVKKYSFFEELYKRPILRDWVSKDGQNLELFFKWIVGGKFNETGAKDVRALAELMENPRAFAAFKQYDVKQALRTLHTEKPELGSQTFQAINDAIVALRTVGRDEYKGIPKDTGKVKLLRELYSELDGLFDDLRIKK